MNYYDKYSKYKNKYLNLKSLINKTQTGGDKPILEKDKRLNFFTEEHGEAEQFLNPVHGLILAESGYIINNYWLTKNGFLSTDESELIMKISKNIPGSVQPTNDIMNLKPIDFGRYIAIKYINKDLKFVIDNGSSIKFDIIGQEYKLGSGIISRDDKKTLVAYINKFNRYVKLVDYNGKNYFHIILYCLYWKTNNYSGILEYYSGINEVFCLLNRYFKQERWYRFINTSAQSISTVSFESVIIKITQKEFKIHSQEWAKNFCDTMAKSTYPDCGETTARNLINLLCFNGVNFDLGILQKLNPNPNPKLIEYYTVFNNFNLQSTEEKELNIYGKKLNSRDAWSKLIIDYASSNINFNKSCSNTYGFELNSGLSTNDGVSNFFQLIKNLLFIEKWDDLVNDFIEKIEDMTTGGIGVISILHKKYGNIVIHCNKSHYHMEQIKNEKDIIDLRLFNKEQKLIIDILLKKNIKISDYMWVNYDSNLMDELLNSQSTTDLNLKFKLFELSITDLFDSDLRRRITLDVESNFFNDILNILLSNEKCGEYLYSSPDYEFIKKLPALKHLNCKLKNKLISNIDLSPLTQVESIGDGFLSFCYYLSDVDLSSLTQVKSIGNGFLMDCTALSNIDLSSLAQVKSIGNGFLSGCAALSDVNLSSLTQIETIGNEFLFGCRTLTDVDLSPTILTQVKTIGNGFLGHCHGLTSIDLSSLTQVKSIGNKFLFNCVTLSDIDLTSLDKIKSVGDNFLFGCEGLTDIVLTCMTQVESIGNDFLSNCYSLSSIDLSHMTQIKSIGAGFLSHCAALKKIDLTSLTKIKSIDDEFLGHCRNLSSINLSPLTQVKSIGNGFLYSCTGLTDIDLSSLTQVKSIGNEFLGNCTSLTGIDLSPLAQINSTGDGFLGNCSSLASIDLSPLTQIKSIGNYFLSNCHGLSTINLSHMTDIKSIGEGFLGNCSSLTSIDLSHMGQIKSIGIAFLYGTNTLINIKCSRVQEKLIKQNLEHYKLSMLEVV